MKRTFAAVILLAALGMLCKLALKDDGGIRAPARARDPASGALATNGGSAADPEAEILAKYPKAKDRELVERVLSRYRHTAVAVERTDGLRGLALLDRLDIEAIHLYEKYPNDFRRLRDSLTDDSAADLLLHWREYFGLKRADDTDRGVLIAEIARLNASQKRAAARYPNALPLILADPVGVTELIRRLDSQPQRLRDSLVVLDFISLEHGAADLRSALRTLDHHGTLALDAFRLQGPDGFALVSLYGPVLEAMGDSPPLEQSLIMLRVNTEFADEFLRTGTPEKLAGHLRHASAAGLIEAVGGSPHALRLLVEYGDRGERALAQAGPDAADVVFEDYLDPTLRRQAVEALADYGSMALAMLAKYAADPDFRDVLRNYGAAVIPPIAQADAGPETLALLHSKQKLSFTESAARAILFLSGENGQATIHTIKKDGLDRVSQLNDAELRFEQFLPLYDLLHLGGVLTRGHAPTSGEMTWALLDGCFVVADVLSLAAIQPEGAAASEAARTELKAVARETAKTVVREVVEDAGVSVGRSLTREGAGRGSEALAERMSKWWTVRLAGGTYQVLRKFPEAIGRIGVVELAEVSRPLCKKAGLRLSGFTVMRFLKNGSEVLRRIPPRRGVKYVAAQALQATVGVVAFHKMEEHLASRRP